ncbi:hypothetical protein H1S01_15765 [Heliobacterium chlorum]|uniref:Uncharacterized protein n=1 Tax=Heliobacterium chlorum TaxID=2698 RepID=A0ABR7T574_HELCL|nr:hypothetical protein [Heliobacterium chlorum]MBC9785942.1 hypothetical protein [Heliobacterium chlorum]
MFEWIEDQGLKRRTEKIMSLSEKQAHYEESVRDLEAFKRRLRLSRLGIADKVEKTIDKNLSISKSFARAYKRSLKKLKTY